MLILYFENWRHHKLVESSWVSILLVIGGSGRVGSGRVADRSTKWTCGHFCFKRYNLK